MVASALRELSVDPEERRRWWLRVVVEESRWLCRGLVARGQTC